MALTLTIIVGILFVLAGVVCIVSIIAGVPGTWIILAMAFGIELADGLWLPVDDRQTFPWWLLGTCVGLAALGEVFELIAGALGAKHAGGSRAGTIGALLGGLVGSLLMLPLLPPFGPLIGAVAGTFAGAIIGELNGQDATVRTSLKPATGATIGRVLGTLGKLPVAAVVLVALAVAAFWP